MKYHNVTMYLGLSSPASGTFASPSSPRQRRMRHRQNRDVASDEFKQLDADVSVRTGGEVATVRASTPFVAPTAIVLESTTGRHMHA